MNISGLDISYAEIQDLSPLKNLTKLTNLVADWQMISVGTLKPQNNQLQIDFSILDRQGNRVNPSEIFIRNTRNYDDQLQNIDEIVNENGLINIDISHLNSGTYSIYTIYDNEADGYKAQTVHMFQVK